MASDNKDRIDLIDEKIAQLKAKKQAIVNREKQKDRKARTRRLIQYGALVEKYFSCADISTDDLKKLLQQVVDIPDVKAIIESNSNSED